MVENPLMTEDSLMVEDPLLMEDSLMVEDPLIELEDPLDPLVDKEHQALRTSWTSKTCNSPDSSSNTEYLPFGEYLQFSGTVYSAIG